MCISQKAGVNMNNNAVQTYDKQIITQDLYNDFVAFIEGSTDTIKTYRNAVKQLFIYLQANQITQPTYDDIKAYRDELRQTHKPATVQLYIVAIKQFFKWTEQRNIYPNVAEGVKGAKIDRTHKRDYLPATAVQTILKQIDTDTLQGMRDYALITLAVTGGLRTVELQRANIEDLTTVGGNSVIWVQGKGHDEKAVYVKLPAQTEQAIRRYLAERTKAGYTVVEGTPLFISTSNHNNAGRMTTRSISRIVKEHLKEAGYNSDRLTAHSLRHTAVTLALLQGEGLAEVQQFARHQNIATTQIYNHAVEQEKNTCSTSVANMIFGS